MDARLVMRSSVAAAVFAAVVLCAAPLQAQTPGADAEMEALLSKAHEAIDSNHLAEAIRSYVGVIAIFEEARVPETRPKAETAAAELARIGARLSIEPASEWVDARGSQIAATTGSVGKPGGLSPGLYLYENFGSGKSPVADAPIHFEFVKNGGTILSLVSTDAYGKANTNLARLEEPAKEAVVRAYPLFGARGKSYAFRSVFRDFAYVPSPKTAKVAALENSELGSVDDPQIVDSLVAALGQSGLQLSPSGGKLDFDGLKKALGGDPALLASLGAEPDSYAVLALVEVGEVRQLELNGKKYNIFTATTRASFRIVRADGQAVYALPLEGIKAQGPNRESAVADGYRRAREALMNELRNKAAAIAEALAKD
jgi:hypothetical protein